MLTVAAVEIIGQTYIGIICIIVCVVIALVPVLLCCYCYATCCLENRRTRRAKFKYEDDVEQCNSETTEDNYGSKHKITTFPTRVEQSVETKHGTNKKSYGYICEYCGKYFRRTFALEDHKRDTFFAKCRFRNYKQVQLGDNSRNKVTERCEQAALYKDNYTKCRDTVIEVLTKMLGHSSNGGRFGETPDREGSTKTGLKTRKAVEFDFSVALLLHENPDVTLGNEINNDIDDTNADNISLDTAQVRLKQRDVNRFNECCRYGVLSPYKLRNVFHRFIISVKNTGIHGVNVIVSKTINGPAVRLIIEHCDIPHKIDVDLTLKIVLPSMLEIHGLDWPRKDTFRFLKINQMNNVKSQSLYLVAKKEKFWSVSFANYENAVLNTFSNTSTEKKILRCMKVRLETWRTQSPVMKPVSSYILKEVFFWLRENLPEDNLWTPDKCAERYCNFLEELKFRFRYKHLCDYFFPTTDLMKGKENSCATMIKYLDQELEWIQANE